MKSNKLNCRLSRLKEIKPADTKEIKPVKIQNQKYLPETSRCAQSCETMNPVKRMAKKGNNDKCKITCLEFLNIFIFQICWTSLLINKLHNYNHIHNK